MPSMTKSNLGEGASSENHLAMKHRPDILVTSEEMALFDAEANDFVQRTYDLDPEADLFAYIVKQIEGTDVSFGDETVLELFGFEKLLPSPEWPATSVARHVPSEADERPKRIDLSSWSAYRDSRHSAAYLAVREDAQKAALKRVEAAVISELKNQALGEDEYKPPSISLRLASEYEGCASCGEGKADKWTLDHRRTIPEYRIRRRFEPRARDIPSEPEDSDDDDDNGFDDGDSLDEFYESDDLGVLYSDGDSYDYEYMDDDIFDSTQYRGRDEWDE
ncbi:hypothetical protein I317_00451 [Kwoniella heveanensis CBS 569]|nr:hypothetical protein I317_00451 [Kwoniella heveanensis CBS 569]